MNVLFLGFTLLIQIIHFNDSLVDFLMLIRIFIPTWQTKELGLFLVQVEGVRVGGIEVKQEGY